jgi:hypothetical protein
VLADGRVLAAGGYIWATLDDPMAQNTESAGAELFDPTTHTWAPTASLLVARSDHRATLLADGRVLVAGGQSKPQFEWSAIASAELFDPVAQTWRLTTPMNDARTNHAQVRLPDGRIWVAGGVGSNPDPTITVWLDGVEVFDPSSETWTRWAPLAAVEPSADAVLLGDGRVLVLGLFHNEIYDPAVGSKPAPPPPRPYQRPTPYAPNEGIACFVAGAAHATALATGGAHVLALQMSLVLERHGDAFTCKSLLGPEKAMAGPVESLPLPSGQLLFAFGSHEMDLIDPATGLLTPVPSLIHQDRGTFHMLLLGDGSVLVTGGNDGPSEILRWQ